MKREFSAGGIVFNTKGQVLVIKNMAMRDPSKSYWGFPKGHLDKGEKSIEAALREVKEEVGIEAEVIKKIGQSKYVFTLDGQKIFKVVSMFKMTSKSDQLSLQTEEIQEARWVDPEEALKILSFPNDKKLLKQSLAIL